MRVWRLGLRVEVLGLRVSGVGLFGGWWFKVSVCYSMCRVSGWGFTRKMKKRRFKSPLRSALYGVHFRLVWGPL